jgi:FkbM family methyltransferase
MQLGPILTKARQFRNFWHVRNYSVARTMTEFGVTRHACVYDRATKTYWIRELDLRLAPPHHGLLRQLGSAIALKRAGVKFSNVGGDILAHASDFSVFVETAEQLFLLHEIVAGGVYNVISGRQGSIVLDIGMNVGFASLYFAAQPWVEAVRSYEPVPETYARALRNFERNPALAAKITPQNFGLSDAAGKVTFDYCRQWAAAVGVGGLNAEFRARHGIAESDISRVTVDMQDVCVAIQDVRAGYPRAQIIVKIDCEGAEYAIIAALHSAGLLRQVDAFLIEWHERGPRELEQALAGAGFLVLSLTPGATATGMLYAHLGVDPRRN